MGNDKESRGRMRKIKHWLLFIGVSNERKPKLARYPNEERVRGRDGGLSDRWSLSVLLTCSVGWLRLPSRVAFHQNGRGGWFELTDSFCLLYRIIELVWQPDIFLNTKYLKIGKLDNQLSGICSIHSKRKSGIVWQMVSVRYAD